MVKRITAAILLAVLLLLSACGEQNEAAAENDIRPQALKAAQAYRGLLPEGEVQDMQAILDCLKEQGYAAADVGGQYAFVHPEQVRAFFTAREDSREASCRFLRICWDGGLIDTHLNRREEEVSCRLLRVAWDGEEPMVTYDVEYPVSDCRLTDKDYLIFTCEIPDNIAESDHDGYVEPTTMLRLTPLDGTCRAWTEGLIGKIGYRGHALFTTDWKLEDMSAVSLNDLFPALYRAETGELLSYYDNPWPTTENNDRTLVPSEAFEALMQLYFPLSREQIQAWAVWEAGSDVYPVPIQSLHGPAQTPVPEVVQVQQNTDGTITLTVDALFVEYATDQAFTHRVTVQPGGDGRYRLTGNEMLEVSILPS